MIPINMFSEIPIRVFGHFSSKLIFNVLLFVKPAEAMGLFDTTSDKGRLRKLLRSSGSLLTLRRILGEVKEDNR